MDDFNILIPFEKTLNEKGELKLFGGIASSTSIDRDGDRMDKSVLEQMSSQMLKNSTVFFNHDTKGLAVGRVADSMVKSMGEVDQLQISVIPTKAEGMKDVIKQIDEGLLKSFSVGGRIAKYDKEYDEKLGKTVRVIKEVDFHEVSVVGVPSNTDASILTYMTKSFQGGHMDNGKPCTHPLVKCTSCNSEVKGYGPKAEPEGGPGEMENKTSPPLDFAKAMDDYSKKFEADREQFKKEFAAKENEMNEKLAAANARIDLLHKSLESKSKSLASESDTLQKDADKESKTEPEAHSFSVFRKGKAIV